MPARAAPLEPARKRSVARFSLTLCRCDDWLIVDEGLAPSPAYLRLLANLGFAAGGSAEVSGEDFQWPPALNRPLQLDISPAAAGQVLASRLQTLHDRRPLARLLLLGSRPAALLAEWAGIKTVVQLELPHGLWQALADPAIKRDLWLRLADAGWL